MHFTSILLLTVLPLTLGLPLEHRDSPTPSSSAAPATTSLTASQIQTLACICEAAKASGLDLIPAASTITALCAIYPDANCTSTPSSSSNSGTSIPLSGGLTSVLGNIGGLSGILSGLPIPIKERDIIEQRQVTESSSGGGIDLGNTNLPALALGATSLPEAAAVVSGVTNAAPGLIDTAAQLASLAGLGNVLARDENNVENIDTVIAKRQSPDPALVASSELPDIDGILEELTSEDEFIYGAALAAGNFPRVERQVTTTLADGAVVGDIDVTTTGRDEALIPGIDFSADDENLLARDGTVANEAKEKRQGLSGVAGALGGITGGIGGSNPLNAVTGIVGSLTGGLTGALTGGGSPLSGVAGGLGGLPVRDVAEDKEKRQLTGITTAVTGLVGGGANPAGVASGVTGLVGSLTSGLAPSTNPLSGVTGGLTGAAGPLGGVTGDLPIVGNGGLSGLSGLTP